MLTVSHVLVGAVAGKVTGNPYVAFSLGAFLHLLFDKMPHYWPEKDSSRSLIILLDLIVCLLVLGYLYVVTGGLGSSIFWGALGGFSVDAVLVPLQSKDYKIGIWHTDRQPHRTKLIYLLTDGTVFLLCALFLFEKGI